MQNKLLILGFFIVITSMITIGCSDDFFDTTLEIDPPEFVEKMAATISINMTKAKGSMVLAKNKPVLSSERIDDLEIKDASISGEFDNGVLDNWVYTGFVCCGSYDNYQSDDFAMGSDPSSYSIEISSSQFPDRVSATSSIPTEVIPSKIVFKIDGGLDIEGDESSSFDITFQDPPGESNYYEISIALKDQFQEDRFFTTYAQTLEPTGTRGGNLDGLLFEDSQFDGEEQTLTLQISKIPIGSSDIDRFYVVFRSITEEFFLHSKTARNQNENDGNPFASPTQVFSNIEGGVGILSVFHEHYIKVIQ